MAYDKTKAWFFSNYIQLFSNLDINPIYLLHFFPDQYFVTHDQYFIDITGLNENIVTIGKHNIIRSICNWIDNNYYPMLVLSESELPNTALYKSAIWPHNQFIFGYDLSKCIFKLLNFDSNNKFAVIDVQFKDLKKAFFSPATQKAQQLYYSWGKWDHTIRLYKFRNQDIFHYKFDIKILANQLIDYLESRDSSEFHKVFNPEILQYCGSQWGLSIYDNLIDYVSRITNTDTIDYRAFHALWEHKKIMTARIEYLEELDYLKKNMNLSKKYAEIEKETNKIRLMVLKHFFQRNIVLIKKIITNIQRVAEYEQIILSRVYENLKN